MLKGSEGFQAPLEPRAAPVGNATTALNEYVDAFEGSAGIAADEPNGELRMDGGLEVIYLKSDKNGAPIGCKTKDEDTDVPSGSHGEARGKESRIGGARSLQDLPGGDDLLQLGRDLLVPLLLLPKALPPRGVKALVLGVLLLALSA